MAATTNPLGIGSVRYDPSKAWREGETPMGVQDWFPAFSNYNALGEGQNVNNIEQMGDGAFRVWRNLAGGADDQVQSRTFTVNPDGSVGWKGSWNTKQQQSQMDHFLGAGLPMALAFAGGISSLGNMAAGAAGNAGGLSGMDLAADAALGTGNNITTAGSLLGGGEAVAGGLSGMDLAADAAAGTGNNVTTAGAGLGGSGGLPRLPTTGNSTVDNLIRNVVTNSLGGGSGGPSILGNILSGVTNNANRIDYGQLIDQIKGIYKPDGEYSKYLENRLGRQDAAAGRNSQYGPRLAQLTGMLADSQSKALQGLMPLMQAQQGATNGVIGAGGRIFDQLGGTDFIRNLFTQGLGGGGSGSGSLGGMSTDWALGPNAGPQLPEGVGDVTDLLDWFD